MRSINQLFVLAILILIIGAEARQKMKRKRKMKRDSGVDATKHKQKRSRKRTRSPVFKEMLKGGKYELHDLLKDRSREFGQSAQELAQQEMNSLIEGLDH